MADEDVYLFLQYLYERFPFMPDDEAFWEALADWRRDKP